MCQDGKKDQTEDQHKGVDGLGTVRLVRLKAGKPATEFIHRVSYEDGRKQANSAEAFRWIPHSVMPADKVVAADCSMRCPGVSTCPSPCNCYAEQCY